MSDKPVFKSERIGEEGILIVRDEPSDDPCFGLEAPEGFIFEKQAKTESTCERVT